MAVGRARVLRSTRRVGPDRSRLSPCACPPVPLDNQRITTNFFQYRSNYTIILAVLLGLGVFTSYTAVAVLCLVIGSYALLLGWTGQLEVFGRVLDRRDRLCIASACESRSITSEMQDGVVLTRCMFVMHDRSLDLHPAHQRHPPSTHLEPVGRCAE